MPTFTFNDLQKQIHDSVLNLLENVYIVVCRIFYFMLRVLSSDIIDRNSTSGSRSQVVT